MAATWIAFGAGSHHFVLPLPVYGSLGETFGRMAFGVGALLTWLVTAAFACAGAKRVFGKKR